MKVLVLADTHKDHDTMKMVIDRVCPDMVVHLGDHADDVTAFSREYPDIQFELVKGNCDEASHLPVEKTIWIDSVSVFLTHGDQHKVEDGCGQLLKAWQKEGCRLILHGHTHVPGISFINGVTIMNPGGLGRISSKIIHASFGVIRAQGDDFECRIFFVDFLDRVTPSYWEDLSL